MSRHVMETEATLPHGWMVQCPDCSRRIWFPKRGEGHEILDAGDFYALHSWSSQPEFRVAAGIEDIDEPR